MTEQALRATRKDIIQQFLTETLVLTAGGGLLGVLFGLLCGPLFRGLRSGVSMISPDLLPPANLVLFPSTRRGNSALNKIEIGKSNKLLARRCIASFLLVAALDLRSKQVV